MTEDAKSESEIGQRALAQAPAQSVRFFVSPDLNDLNRQVLGRARNLSNTMSLAPLKKTDPVAADIKLESVPQFGKILREARENQGLTQQQFADLSGVGRRFLSELENGKSTAEFGKVLQVAQAAGIDLFAKAR